MEIILSAISKVNKHYIKNTNRYYPIIITGITTFVAIGVFILISSQTAFGQQSTPDIYPNGIMEEQDGNPVYQINYNGVKLVATNILNKTTFKIGETVTVIPELTNIGNQTANLGYGPPLFFIEVKDQDYKTVWSSGGGHLLVGFGITLKPNMSSPGYVPAGASMQRGIFVLNAPGNYTVISIADFDASAGSNLSLWSKATHITILPKKDLHALTPYAQLKSGKPMQEIKCGLHLLLMKKTSDNTSVCVKLQTFEKLYHRGWLKHPT